MYKLKKSEIEYFKREFKSKKDLEKREPRIHGRLRHRGLLNVIFGEYKSKPRGYWKIKENCIYSALPYATEKEWQKFQPGAWNSARRNGWLDKCCEHMGKRIGKGLENKNSWGRWQIKENIAEVANKCGNIAEFRKKYPGAYQSAKDNGWLDEVTAHMDKGIPRGYWQIKENVARAALECGNIKEFRKKCNGAYGSARNNGWLEEVTAHMRKGTPQGHWNIKENVIRSAKPYSSITDWRKNHYQACQSAKDKGWFEEATAHMDKRSSPNAWTEDSIKIEASKYKTVKEWKLNSPQSYKKAARLKIIHKFTKHMVRASQLYTKEGCIIFALKYKTPIEWKKNHRRSYKAAAYQGWLFEITSKMHGRKIKCVETGEIFPSQRKAAEVLNLNHKAINAVLKGRYKSTGGYSFTYVNEDVDKD